MKPSPFAHRIVQELVFIFSIVLIFSGCSLIDDFIDDLKKEDPTATKVIGPAGGEINFEGIIINVPENAFSEDNEISISVLDGGDEFGDYGISSLYQVSGWPASINQTIRIKIKYTGTLEGDSLIALGEMKYSVSLDSTLYSYHSESASDSSGYLVYELPIYSSPMKSSQMKSSTLENAMNFLVLNTYKRTLSSRGHFMLSYPLQFEQYGVLMGKNFERAYDTCQAMGFSDSGRTWPANVLARTLSKEDKNTSGWYTWHSTGGSSMNDINIRTKINSGEFTINLNILSDDLELRATCGHEYLHLIQNLYEFSAPYIEPEQAWLKEATAVWIEEKYADIPNYLSSSINGREEYPFYGWQYSDSEQTHSKHGYGLSVIIKDIAEVYGDAAIVKIHKKIKDGILPTGAVDPVDAVLSVINEPIGNFWHGMLGSYMLGHYYNNKVNFKFLDDYFTYAEIFTIDGQNKSHSIKNIYYDLSGLLFKVIPGDLSTLSTVPLSFSVDDPMNCGISVCKYKTGSEIALLGEVFPGGNGQVILTDVKSVFDDGYELVVMVSNSSHDKNSNYQAKTEIELVIELASGITLGKVEFYLDNAVFQRNDEPYPYTFELSEVLHLRDLTGRLSGNIYNGSYSYKSLGRTFGGTIRLTFAENPERVSLSLDHTMSYQGNFGFGERKFHYTVYYNDIPYESFDATSGMFVYSETGSSVSKINVTWTETNSLYTNVLQSHNCGPASFIRVAVDSR